MSLEHKNQEVDISFLFRRKERKENEEQKPEEVQREGRERRRLRMATPQEARDHLNGLVKKVRDCNSLGEVLLIYLFDEGKSGPLNRRDKTVVNEIETPRGRLPVSNEVWENGMKLLATDLGWDLRSVGFETREKEGKEGGVRRETKLATIKAETDRSKGAHLWRIAELDQDSRLISLCYKAGWQIF